MKRNFKNLIEEIKSLKAQLSEDYIFNGDEEGMMGDGMESLILTDAPARPLSTTAT